jgi:hypothetical protein
MNPQLAVLAEIAVGLAGFSSVIVVFRRRGASGAWEPEDLFRFKIMLESSLVAGLFAISPGALDGLGVPPGVLWPLQSALLLGYLVFDLHRRFRQFRSLPADSLSPRLAAALLAGGVSVMALQALNIADLVVSRGAGPYVAGVTWMVVYSGVMFYRLITAPMTSAHADGPPAA